MKCIDVNELYSQWLRAKEKSGSCTIIDVREAQEYAQGHVPNATLIILNTVPMRSDEFPSSGEVYVICRSGMRSSQAIEFLEQQYGHQNLVNVTGGTMAWIEAGYPVEQAS
jgi:rhodanese-related sulfurtransferase